ncbi:MAG: hypothetical protein Hals2KO_02600 [Halioglobus sp.]
MALVSCPDCDKQVSENAPACPNCGAPMAKDQTGLKPGYLAYTEQEVQVLLSKKRKTSHVLHLILSLLTAGIWVIVWVLVAANNGTENARIDKKIAKGKKDPSKKRAKEAQDVDDIARGQGL